MNKIVLLIFFTIALVFNFLFTQVLWQKRSYLLWLFIVISVIGLEYLIFNFFKLDMQYFKFNLCIFTWYLITLLCDYLHYILLTKKLKGFYPPNKEGANHLIFITNISGSDIYRNIWTRKPTFKDLLFSIIVSLTTLLSFLLVFYL